MGNIDCNSVKLKIEREKCQIHNQHPKFERVGSEFSISTCCKEFRSTMMGKIEEIMTEETTLTMRKMLKKAFR